MRTGRRAVELESCGWLALGILGIAGCSAITGFGDLTFDADGGAAGDGPRVDARRDASADTGGSGAHSDPVRDAASEAAALDGGRDAGPDPERDAAFDATRVDAALGCTLGCDDGLSCTEDLCVAGECMSTLQAGFCLIDGVCRVDGFVGDQCRYCSVAANTADWTSHTGMTCDDHDACSFEDSCQPDGACAGTPIPCDDRLDCTTDVCASGVCGHLLMDGLCLVDGACYRNGDRNPDGSCGVCDPSSNTTGFSPTDDLTGCTFGGVAGICCGGSCRIGSVCITDGCVPSCASAAECCRGLCVPMGTCM